MCLWKEVLNLSIFYISVYVGLWLKNTLLSPLESKCNGSCVIESRFLCLSFLCMWFLDSFWNCTLLERLPLRHYWNLFAVASHFWRQKTSLGKYCADFFFFSSNLWIVELGSQIEFWHSTLPGQGSIQLHFVSDCRCLFTIWTFLCSK